MRRPRDDGVDVNDKSYTLLLKYIYTVMQSLQMSLRLKMLLRSRMKAVAEDTLLSVVEATA
jgi:hypothetical protein